MGALANWSTTVVTERELLVERRGFCVDDLVDPVIGIHWRTTSAAYRVRPHRQTVWTWVVIGRARATPGPMVSAATGVDLTVTPAAPSVVARIATAKSATSSRSRGS
jgi:hypothetical protein